MLQPSVIVSLRHQIRKAPESFLRSEELVTGFLLPTFLPLCLALGPGSGRPGSGGPIPGSPVFCLGISVLREEK